MASKGVDVGSRTRVRHTGRVTSVKYRRTEAKGPPRGIMVTDIANTDQPEDKVLKQPQPDKTLAAKSQEPEYIYEDGKRYKVSHQLQLTAIIERMALVALRTINNLTGEEDPESTQAKLRGYVKKVFPVDSDQWEKLREEAQLDTITEWKVIVTVLRGSDLPPRDRHNNSSDPYVKVGIIHKKDMDKKVVLKYNLTSWAREGLLVGKTQSTRAIEENSVNPEWNELLELKFDDAGSEVLVFEVWDRDEEGNPKVEAHEGKINEFTIQGLKRFVKNSVVSDDFMGRAFLPLSEIMVSGEEKTLQLYSHSKKHERGLLMVKFNIESASGTLTQARDPLLDYKLLLKGLVNADSRSPRGRYIRDWDFKLSDEAGLLLRHHDFIADMNDLQRSAITLNVLTRYHRMFGIKITVLKKLVEKIRDHYELAVKIDKTVADSENELFKLLLDDKEAPPLKSLQSTLSFVSIEPTEEWLEDMTHDLNEILFSLVNIFRVHITKFQLDVSKGESLDEDVTSTIEKNFQTFETCIKVAEVLSQIPPLVSYLKEHGQSVAEEVTKALSLGISDWFLSTNTKIQRTGPKDYTKMVADVYEMCSNCFIMSRKALANIVPSFQSTSGKPTMGIQYFSHFILAIDNLLSDEIITALSDITQAVKSQELEPDYDTMIKVYSSYIKLRNIKQLAVEPNIDMTIVNPSALLLASSHDWYKELVPYSIQAASTECQRRIQLAILNEKVVTLTDEVKFSASVHDSSEILFDLFRVLTDLAWPVLSEKMEFTLLMMQEVTYCAQFYVKHIEMAMKDEYIFDESGHFRATQQLGIILNDMDHMSKVFENWEGIYPPLPREEKNDSVVALHAQKTEEIKAVMTSFDQIILKDITEIIMNIVEKIRPDVEDSLRRLLLLSSGDIKIPQNYDHPEFVGSIDPLLVFLESNLQTLATYVVTPIFLKILRDVWTLIMTTILSLFDYITTQKHTNRAELHEWLYYALQMVKGFLRAGGNGLSDSELVENDQYKALVEQLNVLRLPTEDLTLAFLSVLTSTPKVVNETEQDKLGAVLFNISYSQASSAVEVKVFQADKLKNTSKTTLMFPNFQSFNPWVEISLAPDWLFNAPTVRTTMKKNTYDPVFHEDLSLDAPQDVLSKEGATLVVSVYNHSWPHGRHLIGMGLFPCKDIPVRSDAVASDQDESVDALIETSENKNLPLYSYSRVKCLHLEELKNRREVKDAEAIKFLRINVGFN